jgi:hypothetical protein
MRATPGVLAVVAQWVVLAVTLVTPHSCAVRCPRAAPCPHAAPCPRAAPCGARVPRRAVSRAAPSGAPPPPPPGGVRVRL